MYRVVLSLNAEKSFAQADARLAKKLSRAFELLEVDPLQHRNIKRLTGPLTGYSRLRVGDYRVVYQTDIAEETVYVVKIAHRRQAYQ